MRTLDATFLNEVANDPEVRPFLGRSGALDLAPLISDPNNYCFVCENGGFVGIKLQPGLYELHTVFRPGDAAHVMALAETSMRFMFVQTDCTDLRTKVPISNIPARMLAVKAGLNRCYERKAVWEGPDGKMQDVEYFSIGIDKWALKDTACRIAGELFAADGLDDGPRNSFLGGCLMMMKANNAAKGVQFFNRWAAFTEHNPFAVKAINPMLIEMAGKTYQLNGTELECL